MIALLDLAYMLLTSGSVTADNVRHAEACTQLAGEMCRVLTDLEFPPAPASVDAPAR